MVGEFPELQGLMGRYYAAAQGEDPSVAAAIEDHYKPLGPSDRVPTDPVAIAVALADKLDMLVGFWAIDEKPTGSKDPYALRRAALGVDPDRARQPASAAALASVDWDAGGARREDRAAGTTARSVADPVRDGRPISSSPTRTLRCELARHASDGDLLAFFADRLKVQLREQGARHDLVDAVFWPWATRTISSSSSAASRRSGEFLDTDDGKQPARRLSPRREHPPR